MKIRAAVVRAMGMPAPLCQQPFSLDQINEGFDHLASGSSLRDCIVF